LTILEIGEPYIKRTGDKCRCCSDISWGDRNRTLWFEVESEYEDCLCTERIDGFLVSLLPFAMKENLNIRSEGFLSEKLLYQLRTILFPSSAAPIRSIDITAKSNGKILASRNAVGTALSCGVDSFYTVLRHISTDWASFNLTHLTYFNIMNSDDWKIYGEDSSRDFSNARIDYVRPVSEELGLPLVIVDSNFDLFYRDFYLLPTFTFRYLGTVLALQKLFGKYYWSSGFSLSQFDLSSSDVSAFDLLNVQCISNENTTFYSTGSEVTRLIKSKYISDFAVTHKYLSVCWNNIYNCNQCDKCIRTMLTLYVLGKLDLYSKVFDIEKFYQNLDRHLGYMLFRRFIGNHLDFYNEIFKYCNEHHIKISTSAKTYATRLLIEAIKNKLKNYAGI
jgi:hypothetical protein